MEGSTRGYHFSLDVASCVSPPIRLQDYLTSNMTGKNWLISLFFCMEIIIEGRYIQDYQSRLAVARFPSGIIRFQDSYDHLYPWKESIDTYVWSLPVFLFFLFSSLIRLSGVHLVLTINFWIIQKQISWFAGHITWLSSIRWRHRSYDGDNVR